MNKKKTTKKQMSLSQSLFRSKAIKKESSDNKTISKIIKGHNSTTAVSQSDQILEGSKPVRGRSCSEPESNDCDDSFDLFLPRRYLPKAASSQSSFFEVKNRSRYFNESGELRVPKVIKDDDLELALAVSLQESKGSTVSLKPPKTESIQPRGKLKKACSQSLLMRRTPEERERIVTEKVAIVLMDKGKNFNAPVPSSRNDSFSLYSTHLKKQVYEMRTLWALAQTDLSQVKLENFFVDIIIHYLPSNYMNDDDCSNPADASNDDSSKGEPMNEDLQRVRRYSSEDLFGESGAEDTDRSPSPKRLRPSISMEALDKPKVAVSPNCSSNKSGEEQLSLKVDSLDILSLEVEESDSSGNVKNCKGVNNRHNCSNSPTSGVNENPHQLSVLSHQSPNIERLDKKPQDVLRHYQKLSADMLSISNIKVSCVTEVTNGCKIFNVHHCIFQVRCPLLLEGLENNPECLTDYSSEVCEALFGYIYAADIISCLKMDFNQKKELIKCAKKFNIAGLVEGLKIDGIEGNMEAVKLDFSHAPELDQSNISFQCHSHVPDDAEIQYKVHSTPKEIRFSKPQSIVKTEGKSEQVVVLDSDSGSVEVVVNSEGPVSECAVTEDEDLDIYLKDGMRLTEKRNSNVDCKSQGINISSDEACMSPIHAVSAPEKSIDQYFQDSFPSLADIGVAFTSPPPIAKKDRETPEPTPGSSKPHGIVNCVTPGGQLVVSAQATPLPDYDTMLSPELQVALHKYGIRRGIGRQKAVTLLRYIYDQIHPPADHPAVAEAISDVKNSAQQKDASDDDVYSLSSESSGDMQMFEDLGDVVSSVPPNTECDRPSLQRDIGGYIKSNTLLYAAILSYEPIWLDRFHKAVKEHGIKCNKKELMDVLDELGITFRTEQTEKQMKRKGSKRRSRQKR